MADQSIPAVSEEIALISLGRDVTRGFVDPLQVLQPTDTVLRNRGGGDYKVYEELLRDDQVQSTFQQRRLAVISRPWEVVPASDAPRDVEAADYLRDTLKRINFDRLTNKMLFGVFFGYSVAECMWAVDGNRVSLLDVKVKKQRRFRFMPDGSLRLLTMADPLKGEALPPQKFWVFSTGAADDDEPYGLGLGYWLYWPVFFKRNGLKSWSIVIDKFGSPTVVGKYNGAASPQEKKDLLAAGVAVQTDAAVAIPESMSLELLEAARSGSVDQPALYDRMDAAISKVVLSQTMTTDNGSSLSQAGVHMDVRQEVVRSDADLVCESFNTGPAVWLTRWNFPDASPPQVWRKMENDSELKWHADLMKTIVDMGVAQPTIDQIRETFGGEWEPKAAAPAFGGSFQASPAPAPAFADAIKEDTPAVLAGQLDDAAAPVLDGLINEVKNIVMTAKSFAEISDKLVELVGTKATDPGQLADIMQRAFAAADLTGRFEVLDESKGTKGA